jgi:hypothetical protein
MAPKKAAKKPAGKHDSHPPAKDARRTFEHLGRVQLLAALTSSKDEALALLLDLSDRAFRTQRYKESADLLRAAEHLSFANLCADSTEKVSSDLRNAIIEELAHLADRMREHASKHSAGDPIQKLRTRMHHDAEAALHRGSYRAALELARGAEALAHVDRPEAKALPSSPSQKRLLN